MPSNVALLGSPPRELSGLLIAGGQIFLLNRKYFTNSHHDVSDQAHLALDVFKLGIKRAGLNSGDTEPLVWIDGAVLVILALVLSPVRCASGRQIELGDRL